MKDDLYKKKSQSTLCVYEENEENMNIIDKTDKSNIKSTKNKSSSTRCVYEEKEEKINIIDKTDKINER